jgi:hypothetical protein
MAEGQASVTPQVRVSGTEGIPRESQQFQFRSPARPCRYRTAHMGDAQLRGQADSRHAQHRASGVRVGEGSIDVAFVHQMLGE